MQVTIVGGGISGLACAFRLQQSGHSVTLLEQSDRVGGVIDSVQQDGFLFELGPQSFLSNKAVLDLVAELKLEGQLLQADRRAPRFILIGGKLHRVPLAPPQLLLSSLLGWGTKLRLLSEPFRKSAPPEHDESVASFVRRKFGDELLERLAGPLVSGIYAGDPERLSLRSAFTSAYDWEKKYGSVIRGAMKSRPHPSQPRPTLCSFTGGVRTIVDVLRDILGAAVRTGVTLQTLRYRKSDGQPGFELQVSESGQTVTMKSHAVVFATPAPTTSKLVSRLSEKASLALNQIEYAPVAVVNAGYQRSQVQHPMVGFGFLVPRKESLRALGCVWSSSLFPGRAPEGMVSTASFVGGATDPEALNLSETELAELVEKEIAGVLGISGPPVTRRVQKFARAIPQYNLGHGDLLRAVRAELPQFPGLFLTGSYFEGPAIAACVEHAAKTAQAVSDFLKSLAI